MPDHSSIYYTSSYDPLGVGGWWEEVDNTFIFYLVLKRKSVNIFWGRFFFLGTFPGPIRSYIGLESKTDRHTHRQRDILILLYKNYFKLCKSTILFLIIPHPLKIYNFCLVSYLTVNTGRLVGNPIFSKS